MSGSRTRGIDAAGSGPAVSNPEATAQQCIRVIDALVHKAQNQQREINRMNRIGNLVAIATGFIAWVVVALVGKELPPVTIGDIPVPILHIIMGILMVVSIVGLALGWWVPAPSVATVATAPTPPPPVAPVPPAAPAPPPPAAAPAAAPTGTGGTP